MEQEETEEEEVPLQLSGAKLNRGRVGLSLDNIIRIKHKFSRTILQQDKKLTSSRKNSPLVTRDFQNEINEKEESNYQSLESSKDQWKYNGR